MTWHSVVGVVGLGAWCSRVNMGCRASCRTLAALSLVLLRYMLSHSMCRWGLFPGTYGRDLRQKGHLSISSVKCVRMGGAPMAMAWWSAYVRLQRTALECDIAV